MVIGELKIFHESGIHNNECMAPRNTYNKQFQSKLGKKANLQNNKKVVQVIPINRDFFCNEDGSLYSKRDYDNYCADLVCTVLGVAWSKDFEAPPYKDYVRKAY
jgi:hypothetical protein